jgi:transposase InsO family protein
MVQLLDHIGIGGNRLIAATLARAAWRLSRETVRRIRHERRTHVPAPVMGRRALISRHPNDVWFADLTTVRGPFGLFRWTLAVVFDGYARLPLGWRLFRRVPTADTLLTLLDVAVAAHGRPRILVTDRGVQFTARAFRQAVRLAGIAHRFGAVGRPGRLRALNAFGEP